MVYLLHFAKPYKHARHYIGYANDDRLEERLAEHAAGRGARLMQVIVEAGIHFSLVRTWPGDRHEERRLKNYHKSAQLCPVCSAPDTPITIDLSACEAIEY